MDQAFDRVFAGDDADQVLLRINHGGQTETRGTEALNDSIGRLALIRYDDSPCVTGERFARGFIEQEVENVYDPHGLALDPAGNIYPNTGTVQDSSKSKMYVNY